jgi:hypothetical protein
MSDTCAEIGALFRRSQALLSALGEETRQAIVAMLLDAPAPMSVNQIGAHVRLSQPAVSHHLKILNDCTRSPAPVPKPSNRSRTSSPTSPRSARARPRRQTHSRSHHRPLSRNKSHHDPCNSPRSRNGQIVREVRPRRVTAPRPKPVRRASAPQAPSTDADRTEMIAEFARLQRAADSAP